MTKHLLFLIILAAAFVRAQEVPESYSNLSVTDKGHLVLRISGQEKISSLTAEAKYSLDKLSGNPQGTDTGLSFNFGGAVPAGRLYYGLIHYQDSRHPQPVFFKRAAKIEQGRAQVAIAGNLSGKYDMTGWEKKGRGTLGYRVADSTGLILYEGRINFAAGRPFTTAVTIVEGPFVNLLRPTGATISFRTDRPAIGRVKIDGKTFADDRETIHHEIKVEGLTPARLYPYSVSAGAHSENYALRTAPLKGTRRPFVFAYASDSRSGNGGGERDVWGANYYIMKKIMALNSRMKVSFMQFTGDLINGYLTSSEAMDLQYANWKRSVEPFAHYFPVYVTMGNHEALMHEFHDSAGGRYSIDRFPFETHSAEAVFARNFVNPLNGPKSEDGAAYDPDPQGDDFPPYSETCFYYIYDNLAVIVLNSDYWYAPSLKNSKITSGNLHGYIMDQQLAWLENTLQKLESDSDIDHIMLTEHTPFFPNGGHVGDDMWYHGDNEQRPWVAGRPVDKGIIERRDQLLDLVVNKSRKVAAILTGDEHNYNRLEVGPQTAIYPQNYEQQKIALSRTIWQINNGSAGAPYYAQELTPWSDHLHSFTTQNVVVYFHVHGKSLRIEVLNPDTLEPVDELVLR